MAQLQLHLFQSLYVNLQLIKVYKFTVNYPNLGKINQLIKVYKIIVNYPNRGK